MSGYAAEIKARLARAMCEVARERRTRPCEICLEAAENAYAELAVMGIVAAEGATEVVSDREGKVVVRLKQHY